MDNSCMFALVMCSTFIVLCSVVAVFGRAVVVNGTGDQSNQILGCANIEPELVANASDTIEISFPRNGTEPKDINRYTSKLTHTYILMHACMQNPIL